MELFFISSKIAIVYSSDLSLQLLVLCKTWISAEDNASAAASTMMAVALLKPMYYWDFKGEQMCSLLATAKLLFFPLPLNPNCLEAWLLAYMISYFSLSQLFINLITLPHLLKNFII